MDLKTYLDEIGIMDDDYNELLVIIDIENSYVFNWDEKNIYL